MRIVPPRTNSDVRVRGNCYMQRQARTRASEAKVSDTESDQCKHETSIQLFRLRPSSDSDARTEISDVV